MIIIKELSAIREDHRVRVLAFISEAASSRNYKEKIAILYADLEKIHLIFRKQIKSLRPDFRSKEIEELREKSLIQIEANAKAAKLFYDEINV